MSVIIVTGASGLIGAEAVEFYCRQGYDVVGIDNDSRRTFFGDEASTLRQRRRLERLFPERYSHVDADIRDSEAMDATFERYGREVALVLHTAAQPSHDWAARAPQIDFGVNAVGTLNLLEATRRRSPEAVFIFTSTNKVYGDRPNQLPLVEQETRFEIEPSHVYARGIDETMSIDQTLHSVFGASKVAADVLVQEYGRYFGLRTGAFRGGCLTGPNHAGTQLHGFLAYLMRCTVEGKPYTVFGHRGKQVRDNIHSFDLISAFDAFFRDPDCGAVYNVGGGRAGACSMLEAIEICENLAGRPLERSYNDESRIGDHIWWITDMSKFEARYPNWKRRYDVQAILEEIHVASVERLAEESAGERSPVRATANGAAAT